MNRESKRFTVLTGMTFLVGAGFIIWFLNSRDISKIPAVQMWIPSYPMFVVTLVCGALMPRIPIIIWPVAVLGVVFGVGLKASFDGNAHNLYPLEMIIWAAMATPGCLAVRCLAVQSAGGRRDGTTRRRM